MGNDSVDKVVELSAPLGQLRARLAELAAEYAQVKAEIDQRIAELAKLMGDQVMPLPEDATLRENVLAIFRCDPKQRLRAPVLSRMIGPHTHELPTLRKTPHADDERRLPRPHPARRVRLAGLNVDWRRRPPRRKHGACEATCCTPHEAKKTCHP